MGRVGAGLLVLRAIGAAAVVGSLAFAILTWLGNGGAPMVPPDGPARGSVDDAPRDAGAAAGEEPAERDPRLAWAGRFGVAGPGDASLLPRIGVRWFYDYSPRVGDVPSGLAKMGMLRAGTRNEPDLDQVRAEARAFPGRYWLIFNEPDLLEQDGVSDALLAARGEERFSYYARRYHAFRTALREVDPTAKLVGPNLFNLDEHFDAWIDGFRAAYRAEYGDEPTFDVWSFHIYLLDWQRAPMLDRDYARRTIARFRAYVAGLPGPPSRIWLTEFGSLWTWDRPPVCLRPDCACVAADPDGRCREQFTVPEGARYTTAETADYVAWLVDEAARQGIERWFFFAGKPYTDPPFVVPAGLANGPSLFDASDRITPIGERYRDLVRRGPPADRP